MDFVIRLLILNIWKGDSYDHILVIVNWLTKMVYYKPGQVIFYAPGLAKVIVDMLVGHHGLPNSMMSDKNSLFTSKFWFSLCYFFDIKKQLSTAFYPQKDR